MLRKDVELAAKDLEERDNNKPREHRSRSGERPAVVPSEPSQADQNRADQSAGITERPSASWRPFSSLPPSTGRAPQVTYPPERRDTWVDSPLESSGFYSRTDEQVESVPLPRPPRVPRLSEADESEGPIPGVSQSLQSSGISRARRESRPRVFIPARLRRRADEWLATGSLNLPAAWSARHARAMQRGLLLALLMEPGWAALPEGMQQRAGWLFREGWAEGVGVRDADDVMTLLQLPHNNDARDLLVRAVESVFPDAVRWAAPASSRLPSRPPSARAPSTRPPSAAAASPSGPPTRPASYRWTWMPSEDE